MGSFGQVDLFSQYLYLFFIHPGFVTALAFEHEEFWGGELGLISAIPGQSLCPVVQMYLLSTVCWLVRSWWNKRKKSPSLLHWAGTWSTACWLIRTLHYRLLETGKKLYFVPMSLLKHLPLAAISRKMLRCGALISLAKFAADLGKLKIMFGLNVQLLGLAWLLFCKWFDSDGIPPAEVLDAVSVTRCFHASIVLLFELSDLQQKGQWSCQLSRFPSSCRTYRASWSWWRCLVPSRGIQRY